MRSPHLFWRVLPAGLACLLAVAALAQDQPELMTDAAVAALERENALWRQVQAADDVSDNLTRLRAAGFTAGEIAAARPKLEAMWAVPFERNFGWLREDTVERIREIDRQFIARMRAARLYANTGIRAGGQAPGSAHSVDRQWRSAILRALDYNEIAEFRLMNSPATREVTRCVEGLALSADELRTLFVWQRESAGRHVGVAMSSNTPAWLREEQLDDWRRIRDLLGDERFVVYLSRANPLFARMHEVLNQEGPVSPAVALDLWWLRRKDGAERDEVPQVVPRDELTARMRARAMALMGEARFAAYEQDPDARWIVIPLRPMQPRQVFTSNKLGIGRKSALQEKVSEVQPGSGHGEAASRVTRPE